MRRMRRMRWTVMIIWNILSEDAIDNMILEFSRD
jgi:hypothetical protein